jgi:Holliday junction resolvase RusA-like endonuclease
MSGKRDTKEYREFKGDIKSLLGDLKLTLDKDEAVKFTLVVGYSNSLSDLDNCFKPLLDSMQIALGFNDRQVFAIEALKDKTKKGEEYIMIRLEVYSKEELENMKKTMFPVFHKEDK